MKIIFLPEVLEYFGFEKNAVQYIDDLLADIQTTISIRQKKDCSIIF